LIYISVCVSGGRDPTSDTIRVSLVYSQQRGVDSARAARIRARKNGGRDASRRGA
jgi:hypothetical protein